MTFSDMRGKGKPLGRSLKLIGKDAGYALIGLAVSIALAVAINPEIKAEIVKFFFGG
ncbi:MAG: hypothetical protein U5K31_05255 [Balneolaceae bacterium]|nr:hypothetical protein [Balneolaceae bacterium]